MTFVIFKLCFTQDILYTNHLQINFDLFSISLIRKFSNTINEINHIRDILLTPDSL